MTPDRRSRVDSESRAKETQQLGSIAIARTEVLVHSSRKKNKGRSRIENKPDPSWPTHSQMGNPIPTAWSRSSSNTAFPALPWSRCSTRPLVEAEIRAARRHRRRLSLRRARPPMAAPQAQACAARQAGDRRTIRRATSATPSSSPAPTAIYLGLCQMLCTPSRQPRRLHGRPVPAQRRLRRHPRPGPLRTYRWCSSRPACRSDREIIETYRQELVAEVKRVMAGGGSAGDCGRQA